MLGKGFGGIVLQASGAYGHSGCAVVRQDDYRGIPILAGEIENLTHCVVEGEQVFDMRSRVIGVGGVIHLAAFHHKEETLAVPRQLLQCLGRHLGERRFASAVPVYLETHIRICKYGPLSRVLTGTEGVQVVFDESSAVFGKYAAHIIAKIGAASSVEQVEILRGYLAAYGIPLITALRVGGTGGRSGVEIFHGHNHARRFALSLCGLEYGRERLICPAAVNGKHIPVTAGCRKHGDVAGAGPVPCHKGTHRLGRTGYRRNAA